MDGQRFDLLTRRLASTSRRHLIRTLAGGAIGGLASLAGGAEAKPNETCPGECGPCEVCDPSRGRCIPRDCHGHCRACDPATGKCVKTCPEGSVCRGDACCPTANACGDVCLAAPCDEHACEACDPKRGACVSTCDPATCQVCDGDGFCRPVCDERKCQKCDGSGVCVSTCSGPCEQCDGQGGCIVCDPNACGVCDG
ncbi:MAG TPA: hypothetical protein VH482_30390, partial [Thermomicrobiales bacterium]